MNRLKELRKEKSLTQQGLADKIGTTKLTVSNWENEKHVIKSDKAQQLADFFGVSVGYLLGYSKNPIRYNDEKATEKTVNGQPYFYSSKRQYDKSMERISGILYDLVKNQSILVSDNEIEMLLNFIDNMRLDNPYTLKGAEFWSTFENATPEERKATLINLKKNGYYTALSNEFYQDLEG